MILRFNFPGAQFGGLSERNITGLIRGGVAKLSIGSSFFRLFLYSTGVLPVISLKTRLKVRFGVKPRLISDPSLREPVVGRVLHFPDHFTYAEFINKIAEVLFQSDINDAAISHADAYSVSLPAWSMSVRHPHRGGLPLPLLLASGFYPLHPICQLLALSAGIPLSGFSITSAAIPISTKATAKEKISLNSDNTHSKPRGANPF